MTVRGCDLWQTTMDTLYKRGLGLGWGRKLALEEFNTRMNFKKGQPAYIQNYTTLLVHTILIRHN